MAESIIAADIGASNDNAVTGIRGQIIRGQMPEVKLGWMQNAFAMPAVRRSLLKGPLTLFSGV
jgi:hypothetical protein